MLAEYDHRIPLEIRRMQIQKLTQAEKMAALQHNIERIKKFAASLPDATPDMVERKGEYAELRGLVQQINRLGFDGMTIILEFWAEESGFVAAQERRAYDPDHSPQPRQRAAKLTVADVFSKFGV